MLTDRQIRLNEVCDFLEKHNWLKIASGDRRIIYRAPDELGFAEQYDLGLPANLNFLDFDESLDRCINFIAEIYEISSHEVCRMVKAEDTILSVRLMGEKTSNGTFPINSMKDVLDNVTNAIRNAANFVAFNSDNTETSSSRVDEFIKKCSFLQTEIGSFIIKIRIPSNEILKEGNLIENSVYSDAVGNEISSAISFVNNEIFNGDDSIENDEYIANNYHKHSSKTLSNISSILEKSDVDKIEFSFTKNNVSNCKIEMESFKGKKLQKLKSFVERLEKVKRNIINIDVEGKIVKLESLNPESNDHHLTVLFKDDSKDKYLRFSIIDYEKYKKSVEAHLNGNDVRVKGEAIKSTKGLKLVKLDLFEIK